MWIEKKGKGRKGKGKREERRGKWESDIRGRWEEERKKREERGKRSEKPKREIVRDTGEKEVERK
jgi:hypothetical protein